MLITVWTVGVVRLETRWETRRRVSRSESGNPPLVRFQKAGNPPAGFQVKKLETRHLGLPMMTQWAKVTKMFQNTKILTDY